MTKDADSRGRILGRERGLRFGLCFLGTALNFLRTRQAHQHLGRNITGLGEFREAFLAFVQRLQWLSGGIVRGDVRLPTDDLFSVWLAAVALSEHRLVLA